MVLNHAPDRSVTGKSPAIATTRTDVELTATNCTPRAQSAKLHSVSESATLQPSRKVSTAHRITTCAQRLTDQHGLDGFTMDDLAAEAGVSRRTLFNYFPGKVDAVLGPGPGATSPPTWSGSSAAAAPPATSSRTSACLIAHDPDRQGLRPRRGGGRPPGDPLEPPAAAPPPTSASVRSPTTFTELLLDREGAKFGRAPGPRPALAHRLPARPRARRGARRPRPVAAASPTRTSTPCARRATSCPEPPPHPPPGDDHHGHPALPTRQDRLPALAALPRRLARRHGRRRRRRRAPCPSR